MYRFKVIFLALSCLWLQSAAAAPFCVQIQGISPQCDYQDVSACRKRAKELSSICIANPAELTIPHGIGHYCLVYSSRVSQCIYVDYDSCNKEAEKNDAVCIDNTPRDIQPDPYRSNPGLNY